MPIKKFKIADHVMTMLCDDIREEIGNKHSFMGVYQDNIAVAEKLPLILPKICLVITLKGIRKKFKRVKATLNMPECDPKTFNMGTEKMSGEEEHKNAMLMLALSPLRIEGVGPASFELDFGTSDAPELIHEFNIEVDRG